jgi:hypothetical protein
VHLKLLEISTDLRYTKFTDSYFDTANYELTSRDIWLRKRNDTFEMKWPRVEVSQSLSVEELLVDYYDESTDLKTIREVLRDKTGINISPPVVPSSESVTHWLHSNSLSEFAHIQTSRQRFIVEITPTRTGRALKFNVDLDKVLFLESNASGSDVLAQSNNPHYEIGEVELINTDGGYKDSATVMKDIFTMLEITTEPVRGKVLEYLIRYRPAHYEALVDCGLILRKLGSAQKTDN